MSETAIVFETRKKNALSILKKYFDREVLDKILFEMGIDEPEIGMEILNSSTTTFEDFQKAVEAGFSKNIIGNDIPTPRLKLAWVALTQEKKEAQQNNSSIETIIKTMRPIGQWSDFELLENYGKDVSVEVEEQLKKRSKSNYCITFFENGQIDVENSLYMLRKARYQETPATFIVQGEMRQFYKIGEFPLQVFYECPIHNNVLLIDGYCEECGMSHALENLERLVFIRLISSNSNIEPRLYRDLSFGDLTKQYPKIFTKFKELKDEDKLPSLKRRISKSSQSDPFRVSAHKVY